MVEYDYVTKKRDEVKPLPEQHMGAIKYVMRWVTKLNVAVFRASKGRLMNTFPGSGAPICIVTTTGARSGKTRRIALIHLPHGENKLLVASQGGMSKSPFWYYNIVAHPDIQIMADGLEKTYRARRVSDEEKAGLWSHLCSIYPDFDEYQARTDRNIPVFCCEPVD